MVNEENKKTYWAVKNARNNIGLAALGIAKILPDELMEQVTKTLDELDDIADQLDHME